MIKWAICVLLSSISGSILYVIWMVMARFLKEEDFLYTLKCGIRLVVVFFILMAFASMKFFRYVELQPGKTVWILYTVGIRNILKWLLFIWTFGAICKIVLYIFRCMHLRRLAKTYIPCEREIGRLFEQICQEMGVKRRISIFQSMAVPAARIEGVLRPRICIPVMEYKEDELQVILKHELVHYLNHDRWLRECAILLECIYWFNPLVSLLHRSLECWDEYYCDYEVCNQYGVSKECYINVLVAMAERIVEWKEQIHQSTIMDLTFAVNRKNLKERIGRMMNYKGKRKQKRVYLFVVCGMFALAGCAIVFLVGTGAETAYAKMIEITYEDSSILEELESNQTVLQENIMTPEKAPFIGGCSIDGMIIYADSTAIISSSIKNDLWKSGQFQASSGQGISVLVSGTPADVNLTVGIIEPDGVWRYVSGCDTIVHTFTLNKTGEYAVFVWNQTNIEVRVVGHYITKDSK